MKKKFSGPQIMAKLRQADILTLLESLPPHVAKSRQLEVANVQFMWST